MWHTLSQCWHSKNPEFYCPVLIIHWILHPPLTHQSQARFLTSISTATAWNIPPTSFSSNKSLGTQYQARFGLNMVSDNLVGGPRGLWLEWTSELREQLTRSSTQSVVSSSEPKAPPSAAPAALADTRAMCSANSPMCSTACGLPSGPMAVGWMIPCLPQKWRQDVQIAITRSFVQHTPWPAKDSKTHIPCEFVQFLNKLHCFVLFLFFCHSLHRTGLGQFPSSRHWIHTEINQKPYSNFGLPTVASMAIFSPSFPRWLHSQ